MRLRSAADRAFDRSAAAERRAVVPRIDRRMLREAARQPRAAVASQVVIVETGRRVDLPGEAVTLLASEGYEIVRIGSVADAVLSTCAFVICTSAEMQQAACRARVPSLLLDARDPLTPYPVPADSLFMLATVVDLDTGRLLPLSELLTEYYFRNTRNCGYRPTDPSAVVAAVSEMIDGVRRGWKETDAQQRFRRAAEEAGRVLGERVRHVIEWDAAGGFVGDGRLARVQAERAL